MDRDLVINKVLRDMKMSGIISEECAGEARMHLNLLYQAAHEDTIRSFGDQNKKRIECLDVQSNKIGLWDSREKASEELDVPLRTISYALKTGKKIRRGYYFRYAS